MGNLLQFCDEYFRCFSKLRPVLHSKSGSLKDLSLRKKKLACHDAFSLETSTHLVQIIVV